MSLLIVIPFNPDTATAAERLADWCFQLSGTKGHALLVASHDVHGEMCTKTMLAAEVAFESSELIVANEIQTASPVMQANHLFKFAGEYIIRHFHVPWLWLEPFCVPLKADWQEKMLEAYHNQPKRYLGAHLQYVPADAQSPAKICLSRVAVYPTNAIEDLSQFCAAPAPFNLAAAELILPRSTKIPKGKLIQELALNGDVLRVSNEALILNSDKTGKLIEHLQSTKERVVAPTNGTAKLSVNERMAKARAARNRTGQSVMARL